MATRWHVNGEGKPGKCSAGAGKCPFGADAPHFGAKREAQAAAEKLLAASASGFSVSIQAAGLWVSRGVSWRRRVYGGCGWAFLSA